jgi:hypothetical protein
VSIAFVFTNPSHHLEMMSPVIDELRRRRIPAHLVSLAEMRGLRTPDRTPPIRRALPWNIRRRAGDTKSAGVELRDWQRGSLAKRLAWTFGLAPRMAWLLRDASVVVIPNDAVFPYRELLSMIRTRKRTLLIQEGIRFTFPAGYVGPSYGTGGCDAICVWGEGSREYFISTGAPASSIVVTGTPRLDTLDPAAWNERGAALRTRLGVMAPPLAFVSNPIEIQGYGDKVVRLGLFEKFLAAALPLLEHRAIPLIVKTHAYEDANEYVAIAKRSRRPDIVHVVEAPIFEVLAAARAAVVLASTVGLEALIFGLPLGVLEMPPHGYAFEYAQRGAAVPLAADDIAAGLTELLERPAARSVARAELVKRHLHDRGRAYAHVADVAERLAR